MLMQCVMSLPGPDLRESLINRLISRRFDVEAHRVGLPQVDSCYGARNQNRLRTVQDMLVPRAPAHHGPDCFEAGVAGYERAASVVWTRQVYITAWQPFHLCQRIWQGVVTAAFEA